MLIFEDHFLDNRHQWFTTSTERAEIGFETDAYYTLAYNSPTTGSSGKPPPTPTSTPARSSISRQPWN